MSDLSQTTVFNVHHLSEDRLRSATGDLQFLFEQGRPLDSIINSRPAPTMRPTRKRFHLTQQCANVD